MKLLAHVTTKYLDEDNVIVKKGHYGDGSVALRLMDKSGEVLSTPTLNMVSYGNCPAPGNVFIKDYSENEGMVKALQVAGVIGAPVRTFDAGFVKRGVHECPLINPDEIEDL